MSSRMLEVFDRISGSHVESDEVSAVSVHDWRASRVEIRIVGAGQLGMSSRSRGVVMSYQVDKDSIDATYDWHNLVAQMTIEAVQAPMPQPRLAFCTHWELTSSGGDSWPTS